METRAHHVLIGLFTLLIVVAALGFGLWLSKSHRDRTISYYTVVFNETVTGLSRGSGVQYSGIGIGDITEIRLDPNDPRRVLARIRIEGDVPIKQDTQARVALTGITGTSVIQLSGGTPESPRLESAGGEDPVIIATPSPISKLLTSGEDLLLNINELLATVRSLVSPENAARIGNTLASLEQVASNLAAHDPALRDLIQELTAASKQATTTLAQAGTLVNSADGLLKEQGVRTLDSAEKAIASLERAGDQLDAVLGENREALSSGAQGLVELGPAIVELRATLSSLRAITRRLEDNPANYLLGREKIQEFRP